VLRIRIPLPPLTQLKINRKKSEHFPFSCCLSIQEGAMTRYAILGEAVLKQTKVIAADAPAETLETLVVQHTLMVFRIAYSILRNHHDAEDAAQECFLRVLKYGSRLHQVRNPKTWLARVAWTTALDKKRSSRTLVSLNMASLNDDQSSEQALDLLPDRSLAADEQLSGWQRQQLLERLIAGLPEDLRRPLELSTVHELNSAEIAEIMEIPENSVRTRLFRARHQLKEKLSVLLEVKKHG
jgi:RNA polymerase sigma-70 factor (ECF subfamily)